MAKNGMNGYDPQESCTRRWIPLKAELEQGVLAVAAGELTSRS